MALTWDPPEVITLDPAHEADRLEALHSLNLCQTAEDRFDRITKLATEFFDVPTAYVALIDADRQWFKSSFGMLPMETSRNVSLCQYTIQRNEPLIITDTRQHPLSRTHPMVVGEPHLRFYAGVPLSGPRGQKIGTFCLVDVRPHEFSEDDLAQLKIFGDIVEREMNLSEIIQSQSELLDIRQSLVESQARLRREFDDAAKYVRLMLPPPLTGREMLDWHFEPSTHLGGDGLGYRRVDEDRIAFYVLDVTGHGLGSALMAVTALDVLRAVIKGLDFGRPSQVIERLNRLLQMKDHAGKFFSVWYGVYSQSDRKIVYANAGHPSPLLLTRKDGGAPMLTKTAPGGSVLGVFPELEGIENTIDFPADSELMLFTDGIYETRGEGKEHGSYEEFHHYLESRLATGEPPYQSMLRWLDEARRRDSIDDDVTLLRFATTH